MPHFGLSWFRLKEHFRKNVGLYIVGMLVCGILSNVIFSATTPQTPIEQEVLIYLADSYTVSANLDGVAEEMLAYGQETDPTLLEIDFEDLQYSDPNEDYYSTMILMTRLALNEGDAFLANKFCAEQMMMQDYYLPLEDYLEAGWLEGLDLEPVESTSLETGETHIAALRLDNITALADPLGAFSPGEAVLIITPVSTNLETTMNVIEHMLINMAEGNYAPAESTES